MSVADAALVADALAGGSSVGDVAAERLRGAATWHGPHILPAEVLSAVRGLLLGGHITAAVAAGAQHRLHLMRFRLHPFGPFHERVWDLRANATSYDAWYVALAERLGTPLVTTDAKMAGIPGIRCEVEVVGGSG